MGRWKNRKSKSKTMDKRPNEIKKGWTKEIGEIKWKSVNVNVSVAKIATNVKNRFLI